MKPIRRLAIVLVITVGLALMLSACGGGDEAEEAADGGLSEAEKHYNAGVDLQEQGRLEEAIAEYDEAIRLNPQDTDASVNRGVAYRDLGQFQAGHNGVR